MSRFGFAAIFAIGLAVGACSSPEPEFGAAVAAAPDDPIVSFSKHQCMANSFTGQGLGYERCLQRMDSVARANGDAPYVVSALQAD